MTEMNMNDLMRFRVGARHRCPRAPLRRMPAVRARRSWKQRKLPGSFVRSATHRPTGMATTTATSRLTTPLRIAVKPSVTPKATRGEAGVGIWTRASNRKTPRRSAQVRGGERPLERLIASWHCLGSHEPEIWMRPQAQTACFWLPAPDRSGLAFLASPGLRTLADGEGRDHEPRHRVRPPKAKGRVQRKAEEGDRRERGAEQALGGFGHERLARHGPTRTPLGESEAWHDDQGGSRDRDARWRLGRPRAAREIADRHGHDVGGQEKERDGDQPQRCPLPFLAAASKLPDNDACRESFDDGVQAEPNERHRPGGDASRDGNGRLDRHPTDRRVFEPKRPADKNRNGSLACGRRRAIHGWAVSSIRRRSPVS